MISPEILKKAKNMDIAIVDEGKDNVYICVGYIVRYNKRFKNLVCNCEADAMWGNQLCAHRLAAILKCNKIDPVLKEAVEE